MTAPAATATTRTIDLPGELAITLQEFGENADGTGVLVLHGGAGPRSMAGFAAGMSQHAYVVVPTHPGFDGTHRPDATDSVADLATAYLDLLERALADSFPRATFRAVPEAGHFPHIEQPGAVFEAIGDFVDSTTAPNSASGLRDGALA